jgi:hypothetical protein
MLSTKTEFLLLVAAYLQAQACSHQSHYVWDGIKMVRHIPDSFWVQGLPMGKSVENLAFEFASWQHGDLGRPAWLPLTAQEEAYAKHHG